MAASLHRSFLLIALAPLLASCGNRTSRAQPSHAGCWATRALGVNVASFGARGDGASDDGPAIRAAIASLPPSGGVIYFPPGTYLFGSPLAWSDTVNVRFVGAGSRFMQDFATSPSQLVYVGVGDAAAIHVSTNRARGWTVQDLELSYANPRFTGSLVYIDTTAGVSFHHCALGGASSAPPYLASARSVVEIASSEKVSFHESILQFARRAIWVPTCHAGSCAAAGARAGAANTSLVTLSDCQLVNVSDAFIDIEDGGAVGTVLTGDLFDSTSLANPEHGVVLHGDGFAITGNTFVGGDMSRTPKAEYVDLYGSGDFSGNTILTQCAALRVNAGGSYHVAGNHVVGSPAFTIAGGAVSGGGNTWQGDVGAPAAVDIVAGGHHTLLDLGPDLLPGHTLRSYWVHGIGSSSCCVAGIIRYDPFFDNSKEGPSTTLAQVEIRNMRFEPVHVHGPVRANTTSMEAPLLTAVLPARSLDADGRGLVLAVSGESASTGARKRVRIALGDAIIYDSGSLNTKGPFEIRATIYRTAPGRAEALVTTSFDAAPPSLHRTAVAFDMEHDAPVRVSGAGDITLFDLLLAPAP